MMIKSSDFIHSISYYAGILPEYATTFKRRVTTNIADIRKYKIKRIFKNKNNNN